MRETRGLLLQLCRDPAAQARTRVGSANSPRPSEKDVRETDKKAGKTPDRPLAPCGGSGALPAPEIKTSEPSPLRSRGSKAGPPGVSTAAPGQQSQGRLRASLYEAEAQASETLGTPCVVSETGREVSEWDPTVGRHRATEAQRTASAPTRETPRYSWSASPDR